MTLSSDPSTLSNSPTGLYEEAMKCKFRYDYQGAVQVLRRAHKLDPTNDKILVDLGSAHAKTYDFSSARQYFEQAVNISPTKAAALTAVGHAWLEVRNFEAAANCFEQILQSNQPPLVAFVRLAEIYVRMGRLEDAVGISQRAMRSYGNQAAALLMRGKVHRAMRQLSDAERLLRLIVSKSEYETELRAGAWYELGALLDSQGQYDQAMASWMEAKALMRLTAGQALKILRNKQTHLKAMQKGVPPATIQRWRKLVATELQPSRPLALLCGHARSGTTLLEYVVDAHPQVVSAEETSVYHNTAYYPLGKAVSTNNSFVSALEWVPARNLRQIRADYFRGIESYLGQPIGDRLLLDKNPANTFDIPSIARIFPETKYLVALRDPRDVCLSCFMQPVANIPDTSSWLTLEGTMEHFALIMGLWLAWKPLLSDAAIEVRYEDMVANLEGTARPVLDFLGLPWNDKVLRFNEHASSKIVRSPTYAEVSKPIFKSSVGRWRNYQKYFEPHLEKLNPVLGGLGYK